MFATYAEATEWIKAKAESQGKAFYTTPEYKNAYPEIQRLWQEENNGLAITAKKAMSEVGVKFGDTVEYVPLGNLPGQVLSGKITNVNGIPYVKLDQQHVIDKKRVRWHKGWQKAQEGKR